MLIIGYGIGSLNGKPYNCIDDQGECQIRVGGGRRESHCARARLEVVDAIISSFGGKPLSPPTDRGLALRCACRTTARRDRIVLRRSCS
jgi:hypothetical protein